MSKKDIPVAVEEPTEVISAVEEGDIQKPIEKLQPKRKFNLLKLRRN